MPQIARFTARMAALQILLRAGHWLRFAPCPAHAKAHTPRHPTAVSRINIMILSEIIVNVPYTR